MQLCKVHVLQADFVSLQTLQVLMCEDQAVFHSRHIRFAGITSGGGECLRSLVISELFDHFNQLAALGISVSDNGMLILDIVFNLDLFLPQLFHLGLHLPDCRGVAPLLCLL